MTARRFFECRCGHKLRFGSGYCGDCHDATPAWNRRWFWVASGIGVVLFVVLAVILAVS